MIPILVNNFRRLLHQKEIIVLLLLFTFAAAFAAVLASTKLTQIWNIAVVGETSHNLADTPAVHREMLDTAPPFSSLISGKYDGILHMDANGGYRLETIKSESEKQKILNALDGSQELDLSFGGRGVGTNIMGFLMMFLLLMGSMAMFPFSDDKEQGQLTRIAASPLSINTYLLAHSLFNFCFLFIPSTVILYLVKWISGIAIGYSFLQTILMLGLMCAFSTAFCLFLYAALSNKADSAKMAGNTIIILTSILAGSFYAFDKGNNALGFIIKALPQKAYLTVAEGLEQGAAFSAVLGPLLYFILLMIAFFLLAAMIIRRKYINHL